MKKTTLTIGWLYPEFMSTYGDRGNIIVLEKRTAWRGIGSKVLNIDAKTSKIDLQSCDIVLGGGSQDRQQELVIKDLLSKKDVLTTMFDSGIPGLFVCGSPQLLGTSYITGDGKKLPGLGLFDMDTRHFGHAKPRCIGNLVAELTGIPDLVGNTMVGFENHGGRTYLGKNVKPLARVIKGFGNNGEDGTEGAVYNNVIATYSHGPFLPKNPHIADWLIKKALEVKYKTEIDLQPLDDKLEWQAHNAMLKRLAVIGNLPISKLVLA